jgi:carbonic anhydrase
MSYKVLLLSTGLLFTFCHQEEKPVPAPAAGTPVERLVDGNLAFRRSISRTEIEALAHGQHPFAVVVSCSDSRVPPELVFDQGLGDLFVVRTAGNIVGEYELGSIEYAVANLHTPVIIVLGHDECGAIHAFHEHKNDDLPGHIQSIIDYIDHEEELKNIDEASPACMKLLVKGNVLHGVHVLKQDPMLAALVKQRKLTILGAVYHLSNGSVELLQDTSANFER